MTIGKTIRKAIKEVSEGLLGLMMPKDFKLTEESEDVDKPTKEMVGVNPFVIAEVTKVPKRARTKSGKYRADDKSTKDYNEAYVGGKAPTRKELLSLKKKKTKRKK